MEIYGINSMHNWQLLSVYRAWERTLNDRADAFAIQRFAVSRECEQTEEALGTHACIVEPNAVSSGFKRKRTAVSGQITLFFSFWNIENIQETLLARKQPTDSL